jgi:hypothetical protein
LGSDFWGSSLGQYGVGAGTAIGVVVLPGTPPEPLDTKAFALLLEGLVANGSVPAPDANTLFSFIVPPLPIPKGGGFHSYTPNFVYTVNYESLAPNGSVWFDGLTYVLTHETAEAATNPRGRGWSGGGPFTEIGDLCTGLAAHVAATATDGTAITYEVQRLYSNEAASQPSVAPCVPAPTSAYATVAPEQLEMTLVTDSTGEGTLVLGLHAFTSGAPRKMTWHTGFESAYPVPGLTDVQPEVHGDAWPGDAPTLTLTARGAAPTTRPAVLILGVTDPDNPRAAGSVWIVHVSVVRGVPA